jgi:tetratricopeptide (TPR) repeat protein
MKYIPTTNSKLLFLSYVGALFLFILAVANFKQPLIALVWGLFGIIILPQGQRWIERKLRTRLTYKIKSICGVILFLTAGVFTDYYQTSDIKNGQVLDANNTKDATNKLEIDPKEQQRKDSFNFYLQSAVALDKGLKTSEALKAVSIADKFVANDIERNEVLKVSNRVLLTGTLRLIKEKKYASAIPELTNLLSSDPNNSELLYNRALCYSKIGKTQLAVADLKPFLQTDERFNKLHEKINPVRKKVVGYETLCCDGSTSDARGRGACSHHGGVCDWNHPIYEEYRQYE